jgi:DNA-directed RNA polymerase
LVDFSDFSKVGSVVDASKHQLNSILQDVPSKGFFDLNKVLRSVFFFS